MVESEKTNMKNESSNSQSNSHLFNFEDFGSQAQQYLESVREKAREILEKSLLEAHTKSVQILEEAEQLREKARQEGFQAGFQQGMNDAQAQIEPEVQNRVRQEVEIAVGESEKSLQKMLLELKNLRIEMVEAWEKEFLRLVCRTARVVLRHELAAEPQISLQWIRETFELCSGENSLVLKLNPEDAALLKIPLERLCAEFNLLGRLEIKQDPTFSRGDCLLKTESGTLDQRLDVQLARIEEELQS